MNTSKFIDGWLWEFIRRNKNYQLAYNTLSSIEDEKITPMKIASMLQMVETEFQILPKSFWEPCTRPEKFYDAWIPDYKLRYDQIPKYAKPIILGKKDIIVFSGKTLKQKVLELDIKELWQDPQSHHWLILAALQHLLAPTIPRNTIFMGVSRNARRADVQIRVDKIISKYVGKTRKRSPQILAKKWPKYLQVYDYKKTKGIRRQSWLHGSNKRWKIRRTKKLRRKWYTIIIKMLMS